MIRNKKVLFASLIFSLSLFSLMGCQFGTPEDHKETTVEAEETKETIEVEEKQTFASVIGIENASVSPFNTLTNFDEFERILEEKQNSGPVVEEYEETVYVDGEYYEQNNEEPPYVDMEDVYEEPIPEPEPEPTPEPEEDTYVSMGVFDITAYTWTGNPMANGEYPYEGCVASCDFAIGTVLYIEGLGTYVVKDVCPTSGVVDIYMNSYDACIQFGRQYRMVYVVK